MNNFSVNSLKTPKINTPLLPPKRSRERLLQETLPKFIEITLSNGFTVVEQMSSYLRGKTQV